MTDAIVKSDNEGYLAAVADGVALEPGTKVWIIDRTGPLFTIVHQCILSGDDKGRSCWAAADAEGFSKSDRSVMADRRRYAWLAVVALSVFANTTGAGGREHRSDSTDHDEAPA
jgi:hypothetical protein